MKIIELSAENIKRLKAVDITPSAHVQVIGGRNAQGKTSVLDAIWLALGGGAASKSTARPIRDGEETATVRLDLGDLVVTRTWKGEKTSLTVAAADGARYAGPQGILDSLVGRLSFDPLEFTRLSARDQVAALVDLVDLDVDLDALAADRARLFAERTEVGRDAKALGVVPEPDPNVPTEEQSAAALIAKIREAQAAADEHGRVVRAAERAQSAREQAETALAQAQRTLQDAQEAEARALDAATALPAVPDVTALEQSLAEVETTNARVRDHAQRRRHHAELTALRARYDALSADIEAIDRRRADALAAATFPVDGLGFDDTGVTLSGLPFSQASSAEQIRVSLAMAMALNPRLRVIRILDGSLLDADNLALIEDMARQADYQVWIERVGAADEGAVIIEDGAVA